MNFRDEQRKRTEYIETIIKEYLPKVVGHQKIIFEAMEYSVLAGGKRLRPMFMLETYRLFGGMDLKIVEPFLVAIEMIHTYSLVHDDLPAMDNDDYRRGRQTTHKVYGEAFGILAGDALLNYAFEIASQACDYENCNLVAYAKAMKVLAKKAGVYGMIGGQVVDVQNSEQALSKEQLDFIYELKTSALIEASMMIGAILAGATDEQVELVEKIAKDTGIAFQIKDDILDVTSTVEELGKPICSDEKNIKTTYVTLMGVNKAQEFVEAMSQHALECYKLLGCNNEFLEELIKQLITRRT